MATKIDRKIIKHEIATDEETARPAPAAQRYARPTELRMITSVVASFYVQVDPLCLDNRTHVSGRA